MGWVLVAAGAFAMFCSAMNFDWFFNSRKAKMFVKIFGRTGARIFYVILGTAITTIGVLLELGYLEK